MIFQLMDSKIECAGTYMNGKFFHDGIPKGISKTWSWSKLLFGKDIDYAQLWALGSSLEDSCPSHLVERWAKANGLLKAHFKAFNTSKMDLNDVCFYDVVPQNHLRRYFDCKNEITKWVFENIERPKNYYFLKETFDNIRMLSLKRVKINTIALHSEISSEPKAKYLYDKFHGRDAFVDYDIFGTITGRLTTKKDTFPILNLKRELKKHVYPTNDSFLELDFNAAEIRTLFSLQGKEQPDGDIHEWNIANVFKEQLSREQAKQKLFAWIYNPESEALQSDIYDREILVEKHYIDGLVHTPFKREIPCPRAKALNYLLQSASSDNTMDRFNKISKYLIGKKSHVSFVIHDSVIIDLHEEDSGLIPYLVQIFGDTKLGKFKVNVSLGKSLGSMKKFKW